MTVLICSLCRREKPFPKECPGKRFETGGQWGSQDYNYDQWYITFKHFPCPQERFPK